MKIGTILDQIDLGAMALPEFQRGYVWNRDQVRGLMHSLYRKHPIGSLLVWVTKTDTAHARGPGELSPGVVELLLDGQQRMTTLYGIVRGKSPKFFDGNADTFTGLHFNLVDEVFEFYAPSKMKDDPMWIDVTGLMLKGMGMATVDLLKVPEVATDPQRYIERLNAVSSIPQIDLHIEQVTGEDKTVDVVVDIFNRVNSGGTKLSKGDLALARICASWPAARDELKSRLEKWRDAGYHFRLEWLLRNVNAILTGRAEFSALKDVDTKTFAAGLDKAEKAVDASLMMIASRLGLDHSAVLGGSAAIPLIARYWAERGGKPLGHRERDRLLYWYIHTFLWGRYAGSTESVLNQDLARIEQLDGGLERLIEQLRSNRGDLRLSPNDFKAWSRGARFYPLLYMLTRVCGTRDWGSGVELSSNLLGKSSQLHLHHIFPKSLLYQHGYSRPAVNALGNFTFLTQETNLDVSNKPPADYLPQYLEKHPGTIESHWIPTDPELWKIENYYTFLDRRRELLAEAANAFLDGLLAGSVPESAEVEPQELPKQAQPMGAVLDEDEEARLIDANTWVVAKALPEGDFMYEILSDSGDVIACFDLAWPDGLQFGLSEPVALLLDEPPEVLQLANARGFRYFTDLETFREYVSREVLAGEGMPAVGAGAVAP